MFSTKQCLQLLQRIDRIMLAVFALLVLLPTDCWGQAAEMRRGQLMGPANSHFGRIVFSPDGKLLAAGSIQSSTISVFDVAGMKEKVRLQLPHNNYDYELAFSADCRTLVSAGREDEMIRTWDVVTGKQLREIKMPMPYVKAFSPGAKRVAVSDRRWDGLAVCDVGTGKVIWQVKRRFDNAESMTDFRVCAFSPDGKTLAVHGGNFEVQILDAEQGALLRVPQKNNHGAGGAFKFVTFSPDSKHIATGGHIDDSLHIWDVNTGKERLRIKDKTKARDGFYTGSGFFSASFSPDGNFLAYASFDGFILYDLPNGKEICALEGRGGIFSPDGALLAVPGQTKEKESL